MTLLDTSVWIQVFRQHNPVDLESVVPFEEIVVCLPVIQEILQGFRDEQAFRVARDSLLAIPCVESPLDQNLFSRGCRPLPPRPSRRVHRPLGVDCLIAACAIRNDLVVIHQDRDYSALARISSLRQRSLAGARI